MDRTFSKCSSLESIDVSNFVTTKVTWLAYMFNGCSLITSLDLSNFDTSKVLHFQCMFQSCISLTYLNLSTFNTENALYMQYMFYNCSNLTSLIIDNFNTSSVMRMDKMFFNCSKLTSINISSFNTESNYNFHYMFYGCTSLKSLNITHFNTGRSNNTQCMFYGCSSLTDLDLSKFDSSNVIIMSEMFANCFSLISLDLSSFQTSNAHNMSGMFSGCNALVSLDISTFNTSKVTNMSNMFSGCFKLKSLILNNFDTYNVESMEKMFFECYSLDTLDITNLKTPEVKSMAEMFARCTSLSSLNISNFDTSSVTNISNMFEDCRSLTSLDLSNFRTSSIENMHGMFLRNNKLTNLDLSNFNFSLVNDIRYMFSNCSNLKYINIKNLVINDNIAYSSLIDDSLINPIICIDDEQSLNKIISFFKCKYLNIQIWGEFMDKIIYDENIFVEGCLLSKNSTKCYKICSYYFYFDETISKYICTEKLECPEPYDKLIDGKNECVKSCGNTKKYKYMFREGLIKKCLLGCPQHYQVNEELPHYCINECPMDNPFLLIESIECTSTCSIKQRQNKLCITNYFNKIEDNFNVFDLVVNQIKNELINNFDESLANGNKIYEKGMNISLSKMKKENTGYDEINFGECEDKLKENYKLTENESLYMLRFDVEQIGLRVPSQQYEILYPINGSQNLAKADLSICSGLKMDRIIYINITDNIEKYNRSSPYYNDICYIPNSDDRIDISLPDRREEYINNNMGICEDGCDFISYNYESQKAICSCNIKNEIPLMNKIQIDKNTLLKSFIDINNIANIQILKCYQTVFQKKLILKNIGFIIFACIIILDLICLLYFIIKDYKKLFLNVYKIKLNILYNKKNNAIYSYSIFKGKKKNEYINKIKLSEKILENNINIKSKKNQTKKINVLYSPPKKNFNSISHTKNKAKKYNNKLIINKSINNSINKSKSYFISHNNKDNKKITLNYNEINHLEFEEALIKDKRTFCQYYLSLLISTHLILFIFYSKDYNSKAIKVSIFLFNLASSIAINSLFFNDPTMHKI